MNRSRQRMDPKIYWDKVHSTRPWQVLLFFMLIIGGWFFYDITDFVIIRWLSAQIASIWLNIFGYTRSIVQVSALEVYIYPLGIVGEMKLHVIEGCTPAAGIFPLICLFAVPHSSRKLRIRNFTIYLVLLFFIMELVNAIEIHLYVGGVPWNVAHNQDMNGFITYCLVACALIVLFSIWPESSIPFAYIQYAIALLVNRLKTRNNTRSSAGLATGASANA